MRFLPIFVLAVASCSLASASIVSISCTPLNNNSLFEGAMVNGGTTQATCGGFDAPIGNQITNLSFSFFGSFSDAASNGNHQLTFNVTTPQGNSGPLTTISHPSLGSAESPSFASAVMAVASVASFNVSVSVANTVGANVLPNSAQYSVFANYTYEAIPSGVPEPSTMALVGGVLLLAGIRKFRS